MGAILREQSEKFRSQAKKLAVLNHQIMIILTK
jgi:hypothetical protein